MLRNLAASVILYEKVETTEAKAKEIKKVVERAITTAKKNTLAARRSIEADFFDSNVTKKLFEVLIARYGDRTSGYTRVIKTGYRHGDGSLKAMITLVEGKAPETSETPMPVMATAKSKSEQPAQAAEAENE